MSEWRNVADGYPPDGEDALVWFDEQFYVASWQAPTPKAGSGFWFDGAGLVGRVDEDEWPEWWMPLPPHPGDGPAGANRQRHEDYARGVHALMRALGRHLPDSIDEVVVEDSGIDVRVRCRRDGSPEVGVPVPDVGGVVFVTMECEGVSGE